jgi:hypothetical protein
MECKPVLAGMRALAVEVTTPATDDEAFLRQLYKCPCQERGRLGWQKVVNYGRRSLGEVAMMCYKTVIGRLHAWTLPTQKAEAAAGCKIINVVTHLGMPISQRIA